MKIGAQLFTLREFCKTPEEIETSLERVSAAGYRAVQASGLGPIEPQRLRACCDRLGLTIGLTHVPPSRLTGELDAVLREHDILGCKNIGIGMLPEEFRDDEQGVTRFHQSFSPIAREIRSWGGQFYFHNHSTEFEKYGEKTVMEQLCEAFPPEELQIILDTYWVQAGGGDVADWIERLTGRLRCVHLKDMGAKGLSPAMKALGEGNMNFPKLLAAFERAGTEWAFVEQDVCDRDPFDCLSASLRYLKQLGWA